MAKQVKDRKVSGQDTLRSRETAKGKSLYLDIYKDGVRSKEYLKMYLIPVKKPEDKITNQTTWEAAEAIARERAQAIVMGKAGIKNKKNKTLLLDWLDIRINQLTEHAKEMGRTDNNSAKQAKKEKLHIEAYISQKYKGKKITLGDVDHEFCVGYGEYLCNAMSRKNKYCQAKPLSSGTRTLYFKGFSTALNAAVKAGHLQANPMERLDITKIIGKNTQNERVYLTAEELRKLINTHCKRENVRNAFLFCCMCGLRWSDVSTLKWSDIHADGNEWKIEKRMIKTSELLYLPLSNEAKNYLPSKELKESDELVFTLPTLWGTERVIADWVKEAKITKHVTFHCARHTFATLMLTQGADLYTTSKLLGHTSVKTTEIYAKIVDKKKVEAVNLLNGIF